MYVKWESCGASRAELVSMVETEETETGDTEPAETVVTEETARA